MQQPNNPLHGKTLQAILEHLVEVYRWEGLAYHIDINCFKNEPSIQSSLKFLRKRPGPEKKWNHCIYIPCVRKIYKKSYKVLKTL